MSKNIVLHLSLLTLSHVAFDRVTAVYDDDPDRLGMEKSVVLNEELKKFQLWAATANFDDAWRRIEKLRVEQIPDGAIPEVSGLEQGLHLRSIAAEICDYLGKFERARDFVEASGRICYSALRSLWSSGKIADTDKNLTLQRVWVVMQAGMCDYRAAKYDSALSMFKLCDQVASGPLLRTQQKPRFGTQARALYLLGMTYREQNKLRRAVRYLTASSELAARSFVENTDANGKQRSLLVPLSIARSIGMGLANVHNSLGRPDLAVPLLMTAKAMLPPNEIIISTHIDLLSATLGPWSYRQDGEDDFVNEKLSRPPAVDVLVRCHDVFRRAKHRLYQSRAAYFLAREFIRCSDQARRQRSQAAQQDFLTKAEGLLGELDYSVSADRRFDLLSLVLQSEIAQRREQFELAEERASAGVQEMASSPYPAVHLELLLARGLARIGKRDYGAAIEDFKSGLQITSSSGNHPLSAVFLLRLSQAYAKDEAYREATQSFKQYKEIKEFLEVETADLRALERETKSQLEKQESDDYVLRLRDNLDPAEEQKQFRRALVRWARSKSSTDAAAAKLLKITRQTLYNWQK